MNFLPAPTLAWLPVIVAIATLAPPTQAHFPAVYGRDYLRWEASPQSTPSPVPTPTNRLRRDDDLAGGYQDQLQRLENDGGPFADGLTDPLISLGRHLQDFGSYKPALELYLRALHIVRVNDGLQSERQLPLLREIMAIHRATENLTALDQTYDYYFRLHGSGQGPYTQAQFDANMEYLHWQQEAHQLGLDGYTYHSRLLNQYDTNERMLDTLVETPEFPLDWDRQLVFNQLRNLYLIFGEDSLEDAAPGVHFSRTAYSDENSSPDYVLQRLKRLQFSGVKRGVALLEDFLGRWPEFTQVEIAAIRLDIGDWYQWNGQFRNATTEYATVERLLQQAGETRLVDDWMGEPVELPAHEAFWFSYDAPLEAEAKVFSASYAVSDRGVVRLKDVNAVDPQYARLKNRLKRMLRGTHFRPRFAEGHGQTVAEVTREYRLID